MEKETFFSIKGRLRRKDYLIRTMLLSVPAAIINVAFQDSQEPGLLLIVGLLLIASGVLVAMQAVKRLHDINMSGWYWFVFLIPLANFIFVLYILFKDGTPGPNEYGEDPKGRQAIELN